jgi:NADH-quinone oxidoreductase subunit G
VLSPHLTVEEAYLLGKYVRSLDGEAKIAMGPIPTTGDDETFPNGFTIRGEKFPNRRGIERIVAHFMDRVYTFDDLLADIDAGSVQAAWVTGGYKTDWIDEATAERFDSLDLLVVQDMFDSPLHARATYQLPGAGFAERDGSLVNFADRLQFVRWSIRPPAGAQVEGRVYWRLLGREGMYDARQVLDEVASEIVYFAAARGEIPPTGVDLKVELLADSR